MREATPSIPTVDVGGVSTPRLILGHLPFVGESYQGDARNAALATTFAHVENTIQVITRAVTGYGITAMAVGAASESLLSRHLLDAVRAVRTRTQVELTLIPCVRIPITLDGEPIDDYRRWVTYYALERRLVEDDLLWRYCHDPILLCRPGWAERFPAAVTRLAPYSSDELARLHLDYEGLDAALASFHGDTVLLADVGSESDFLAMAGRLDLLEAFTGRLRRALRCPVVLSLHHAGTSLPILEASDLDVVGYVTPVNALGALMLPSQTHAVTAIQASRKPVIAIKPMAGGRIPPRKAFDYVLREVGVAATMIGVASVAEVDADLPPALNALHGRRLTV